MSQRFKLRCF
ncbi:hypothetical protein VCNHCC004A_001486A, partial [Vibrio cholerae O1 str. NHCC-004A]